MTQKSFISQLCASNPDAVIIGSIGTISYDLSEIEHPNKILLRGAMGAALGCGLGYAMSSDKDVIVVIGDGSFLMQMGAMSTIFRYHQQNLRVIVINNRSYRSCGGQATSFDNISDLVPFEVYDISE